MKISSIFLFGLFSVFSEVFQASMSTKYTILEASNLAFDQIFFLINEIKKLKGQEADLDLRNGLIDSLKNEIIGLPLVSEQYVKWSQISSSEIADLLSVFVIYANKLESHQTDQLDVDLLNEISENAKKLREHFAISNNTRESEPIKRDECATEALEALYKLENKIELDTENIDNFLQDFTKKLKKYSAYLIFRDQCTVVRLSLSLQREIRNYFEDLNDDKQSKIEILTPHLDKVKEFIIYSSGLKAPIETPTITKMTGNKRKLSLVQSDLF